MSAAIAPRDRCLGNPYLRAHADPYGERGPGSIAASPAGEVLAMGVP
jgi:hypothetical protein